MDDGEFYARGGARQGRRCVDCAWDCRVYLPTYLFQCLCMHTFQIDRPKYIAVHIHINIYK